MAPSSALRGKSLGTHCAMALRLILGFNAVPTRWIRIFNPFSFGPRACLGRNPMSMELLIMARVVGAGAV